MTTISRAALIALVALWLPSAAGAGLLTAPAGYTCIDTVIDMPAGAWFGGYDILPSGNFAISDGYSIREVTPGGVDVGSLYTYSSMVYGSFVKYNAATETVYFGESSTGGIKSVPVAGGDATDVVTLDFSFDMDFWDGVPYVVAGDQVYRVDENNQSADPVAQVDYYSGPVIFDSAGNMIYSPGDDDWDTPRDQNIYQWTAAQVAGAGDGTILGEADATILAQNTAPYSFVLDTSGDLLFSETISPPAIRILSGGTVGPYSEPVNPGHKVTYMRYASACVSAAVTYYDEYYMPHAAICTFVPVPEPSGAAALCSLIALAGSVRLLRLRRK